MFRFLVGLVVSFYLAGCGEVTNADFQSDADVYRLQDLEYYGQMIEAYHEATGTYPFLNEAKELPVYAVIASPEQVDDVQKLPFEHIERTTANFFTEIERGLGRVVEERYDPQFAPDKKPNFYIYMAREDRYFFAVHVSQSLPFAQAVGSGYNKVEISNDPGNDSYASIPNALFAHPSFRTAVEAEVSKPDFFEQRRKQFTDSYPAESSLPALRR